MGIKLPMKAHTAVACVLSMLSLFLSRVFQAYTGLSFSNSLVLFYTPKRERDEKRRISRRIKPPTLSLPF